MKGIVTEAASVACMVPFLFCSFFVVVFLGQVVEHGAIKCVLNEGMPIYRRPYEKGRLIIEFRVSESTHFLGISGLNIHPKFNQ